MPMPLRLLSTTPRTQSHFLTLAACAALCAAPLTAAPSPQANGAGSSSKVEVEQRSTLTRVREGGTPFDPKQRMTPYAVQLAGGADGVVDGGLAGLPSTGLIESPAEYSPTRGVLFQYGNSWNSVVTALVSSLTGLSLIHI